MRRISAVTLLQKLQLRIAMAALLLMMATTVCDVLLRYLMHRPISGAYDIVEVLLAIFVFHGMATTFLRRENIVIDLIDHFVSARVAQRLTRAADVVTTLLLVLIVWAMLTPAFQAYDYGDKKLELGLPVYIVWIAAILGLAGVTVCAVAVLLRRQPDEAAQ